MVKQEEKKRGKDISKMRIIFAAMEVFAKFGYDKATYKAISEVSGLNESLITRYFGSKSGLAVATINQIKTEFLNELSSLPEYPTLIEELNSVVESIILMYETKSYNIVSLFALYPKQELFLEDILKDVSPSVTYSKRFKKFQDSGIIPNDISVSNLISCILNLVHSVLYFDHLILHIPIVDVRKLLSFYIESIVHGLSKGSKSLETLGMCS